MDKPVDITHLIRRFVADDHLHCLWLNTLALLENTGAHKIVASEHPVDVDLLRLKHAAEETRHAYYMKRQIGKLQLADYPDFSAPYILAPRHSYAYLNRLDIRISRLIKEQFAWSGYALKQAAYLLVTYAIEVRAELIYSAYETELRKQHSPVSVRGILAEEENHLREMEALMRELFIKPDIWTQQACKLESELFLDWVEAVNELFDDGLKLRMAA